MRVLIFQAAGSSLAIAAMTRFADETRAKGYQVGLRSLPHFRREPEPADAIIVALTPTQADVYKTQGLELVQVFRDTDRITPLELPEDDDEIENFNFDSVISGLDDENPSSMTLDQLKAEAIERGIEVRADSTRAELEHLLDIDYHPGAQEADRRTDRQNANSTGAERVGLRTSTVLPTTNGLDLERMNDEQLRAAAKQLGIDVGSGTKRADLIDKMTATYADKVGAPKKSGAKARRSAESGGDRNVNTQDDNGDLEGKSSDELKKIADDEGIDVGRATSEETLTDKIVEGRKAKAGGNNG